MQCNRWYFVNGLLALQRNWAVWDLHIIQSAEGGYQLTMVPTTWGRGCTCYSPTSRSLYLDDDISYTNIQSDQFSCCDHRELFNWTPKKQQSIILCNKCPRWDLTTRTRGLQANDSPTEIKEISFTHSGWWCWIYYDSYNHR